MNFGVCASFALFGGLLGGHARPQLRELTKLDRICMDDTNQMEITMERTAATLVEEYLRLGGTRKSANDDNLTSTRKWDDEPQAARKFWTDHIDTAEPDKRREVESLLPSVSDHE